MQKAGLILLNGASYEQWLKKVSLPESRLVDTAAGLAKKLIALEEHVVHSHGPEGKHEHGEMAFTTWMDMTLATEQARAIKDALARRFPQHKAQFATGFEQLSRDLEALDSAILAAIGSSQACPVVFSHPVYQYFQRRYRVNGKSVHWEPDEMPDEAMWEEFRLLLQDHPAKSMLWEGEPLPAVVKKLGELGLESAVIDPCGNTPEDGDFLTVMKANIDSVKQVYGNP